LKTRWRIVDNPAFSLAGRIHPQFIPRAQALHPQPIFRIK